MNLRCPPDSYYEPDFDEREYNENDELIPAYNDPDTAWKEKDER